jgi:hypothetical protein
MYPSLARRGTQRNPTSKFDAESEDHTGNYGTSARTFLDVEEEAKAYQELEEEDFRRYRATITTSTASTWWLSRVNHEMSFHVGQHSKSGQILTKLSDEEEWKDLEPYRVNYQLDWNPRAFYKR